jgi:hypothetical protein
MSSKKKREKYKCMQACGGNLSSVNSGVTSAQTYLNYDSVKYIHSCTPGETEDVSNVVAVISSFHHRHIQKHENKTHCNYRNTCGCNTPLDNSMDLASHSSAEVEPCEFTSAKSLCVRSTGSHDLTFFTSITFINLNCKTHN